MKNNTVGCKFSCFGKNIYRLQGKYGITLDFIGLLSAYKFKIVVNTVNTVRNLLCFRPTRHVNLLASTELPEISICRYNKL